ncbi:adenosylmethionine-8-amino-7-oxononanoate aminotransferase [Litorivivens lipolytica]|uniref:Adenosylmethionine-8-amino-7-oxononanoate aminotransferase n=1 Tax=Litorivivens lipolytica TaxID=1524264 RepID=A0A7W4W3F5_9GAMM|nr:adenosylmethionine--8-amino-7-oxononanoate transaminase [Litorivivens lipolytica]MBB3046184.1 adenosylmethionine-8-amino-7-oxononanoate aminotransferase [Litorivivens lipolytica]
MLAQWTPNLADWDRNHVWHPYSSFENPPPVFPVVSANGVRLKLADGREIIDGMASWWSAIHGYNHPVLNQAATEQLQSMSHVMFGGLTHAPAVSLCQKLVDMTPDGLNRVFIADSGSVAMEVAIKMSLQYWASKGQPQKHRLMALRNGYHGDTFGAMAVCDPVTGMHHLFSEILPKHLFAPAPQAAFDEEPSAEDVAALEQLFAEHHQELAALLVEPVVQGAGGMRFYSPGYLKVFRELCDRYQVLLVFDEIATGFGRSGKLFAAEHANLCPDILAVGKALTGGYLSLAATLCIDEVSDVISRGEAGAFMHGPTFMGNPLACAIANASIDVLLAQDWQSEIQRIERGLNKGLAPARELDNVADVRVLGAIGVIELKEALDLRTHQQRFVDNGVWVRPFGKLVYTMPPYIMSDEDLATLTAAMIKSVQHQ